MQDLKPGDYFTFSGYYTVCRLVRRAWDSVDFIEDVNNGTLRGRNSVLASIPVKKLISPRLTLVEPS